MNFFLPIYLSFEMVKILKKKKKNYSNKTSKEISNRLDLKQPLGIFMNKSFSHSSEFFHY
jgi:hypothetical protein